MPELRDLAVIRAVDFYDAGSIVATDGGTRAVAASKAYSGVSANDRDAILESMFKERSGLTRRVRMGTATADERAYLADLEQHINELQAPQADAEGAEVWRKLEALARSLVSLDAKVAAQKSK